MAVAVEVADRHGIRKRSRVIVDGGLEGAIAVAQQHRNIARERGGYRQVSLVIAV